MSHFARFSLAAILGSCAAAGESPPIPPPSPIRVLFVGNSLTYVNALPLTVAAIAGDNDDPIIVTMSAGPNLALIDHLTGGSNATQMLRDSSWDFVVLQEGPTTTQVCRDSMILWTRRFEPLVARAGGTSITLMTWPAVSQGNVWSAAHGTALLAAASVHGVFAPAGDAWHNALAAHAGLPLYGSDGYHPSAMGSFLTALVIYQRITGRDPRTLAPHAFAAGAPWPLASDTLAWLTAAASAANAASPRLPTALDRSPPAAPRPPGDTTC